jgi:hypothetical protein
LCGYSQVLESLGSKLKSVNHSLAAKLWRVIISVLGVGAVVVALIVGAGSTTAIAGTTTTSSTSSTTTTSTSTTTTYPGETTTTTVAPTTTTTLPRPTLAWPARGSAAILVPQLGVSAASSNQPRQPIASLTKLMTAWVALHRLPLGASGTGPCEVVNASDMALYDYDNATDQSGVKIVLGETLCERTSCAACSFTRPATTPSCWPPSRGCSRRPSSPP